MLTSSARRWLTPRALLRTTTVVAFAGPLTSITSAFHVPADWFVWTATLYFVGLATALGWIATRASLKSPRWILGMASLGGAVGPVVWLVGCFPFLLVLDGPGPKELVNALLPVVLMGVLAGAPLGLLGGVVLEIGTWELRRSSATPALDSIHRSAVWLGGWLIMSGLLGSLGRVLLARPPSAVPVLVTEAAGSCLLILGLGALATRGRWLRRVRAGRVDAWSIVERSQRDPSGLPLWSTVESSDVPDGVLVHEASGELGPYRNGVCPTALVHLQPRSNVREILRSWGPVPGSLAAVGMACIAVGIWFILAVLFLFLDV